VRCANTLYILPVSGDGPIVPRCFSWVAIKLATRTESALYSSFEKVISISPGHTETDSCPLVSNNFMLGQVATKLTVGLFLSVVSTGNVTFTTIGRFGGISSGKLASIPFSLTLAGFA
jgi:hypothetical protein